MSASATTSGTGVPELLAASTARSQAMGSVMVDRYARRYVCETSMETHSFAAPMMTQDPLTGEYTRMRHSSSWTIETRRGGISLVPWFFGETHYPWEVPTTP